MHFQHRMQQHRVFKCYVNEWNFPCSFWYGVVITSRQPVAEIATVFSHAFKANLTAIDAPQPAQPLCPGANKFYQYVHHIYSSLSPIHVTSFQAILVFS